MNGEVYQGWKTDMPEVLMRACPSCGGWGIVRAPWGWPPDMEWMECETCGGKGVIGRPVVVEDCRPTVVEDDPF